MKSQIFLFVAAVAMSLATPAVAQDRPTTRIPIKGNPGGPRVTVSDFQPQSGSVGTLVTINGKGFTSATRLFVGGRRIRPANVSPTALTFRIPAQYGNGFIVLRHPRTRDIEVGSLTVVELVRISQFRPKAGPPGSRVELFGSGFRQGDQVLMNGQPIAINRITPKRILVTIPPSATTDYLTVSRADGVSERTAQPFKVRKPAPVITSIVPDSGPPGVSVRITGQHFLPKATVYYGKRPLQIQRQGPNGIEVRIPPEARVNRHLFVTGANGQARSRQKFRLENPPAVTRIAPTYGPIGQRVELFGRSFRPGDRVLLNGQEVPVRRLRSKQISVTIPQGAQSGYLVVQRGSQQTRAPQTFDVLQAPVISSFAPTSGEPGTRVTISGSYLTRDANVFYGRQRLRISQRQGDNTLIVQIPPRARDQRFTVRTRAGQVQTAQAFQVQYFPVLGRVQPQRGYVGTRVTLRGNQLARAESVLLNNRPLQIVSRKNNQIVAVIPEGARSGNLALQSYGRIQPSRFQFEVLTAPIVSGFAPQSGPPGTELTITGNYFSPNTTVRLGNYALAVVRRALPGQLVVRLPQAARGRHYLWIEDRGVRVRSSQRFAVLEPPVVRRVIPRVGKPGAEITLRGANFTPTAQVLFGKRQAQIIRQSARELVVVVPPDVKPGQRKVRVRDGLSEAIAPINFIVEGAAQVSGFSPGQVEPGGQVVIRGSYFDATTRVFWGNRQLPVEKVEGRGKTIVVSIPRGLSGTRYLFIDDGVNRVQSSQQLQVIAPQPRKRPSRVRVRDERNGN